MRLRCTSSAAFFEASMLARRISFSCERTAAIRRSLSACSICAFRVASALASRWSYSVACLRRCSSSRSCACAARKATLLARSASAYVEINALEKCSESSRARSRGSNSALKSSSSACSAPERRISKDKVFGTVLARNLGARARQTEKA